MDLSTATHEAAVSDAVPAGPAAPPGWTAHAGAADKARADRLIGLSRSRSPPDRDRLLLDLAEMCRADAACATPSLQQMLQDIFMELVVTAEQAIRRQLAEILADVAWAPRILVIALARDDIEIARPIIAQSPVLTDPDLVLLLVEATVEHQIEVARRPRIGGGVAEVIIDKGDPDVLAAVAANTTAELEPAALSRLVHLSERIAALRSPLARHPRLTTALAEVLYGWVGEHLRAALMERFQINGAHLGQAIDEAVDEVRERPVAPRPQPPTPMTHRLEMETRVVQKLQTAGQLRPGLLIRALRDDKFPLFVTALAALGGVAIDEVKAFVDADTPDPLARACTAVGVDHSAFPTLLSLVRKLNHGRPGGEPGVATVYPNAQ